MSVPNDFTILETYFKAHTSEYNFASKEDCGLFTERFLVHLRNTTGNIRYKHLRKYGPATQFNKHAIDVLAYDNRNAEDGTPIMEIDILGGAESSNAVPTWQVRETVYQVKDLMEPEEVESGPADPVNMVPWVSYNEQSFERLKRMLKHDYSRRPQGADFDVSVWAARMFHNQYMGPEGKPLGEQAALERIKVELCSALSIPLDDYYG